MHLVQRYVDSYLALITHIYTYITYKSTKKQPAKKPLTLPHGKACRVVCINCTHVADLYTDAGYDWTIYQPAGAAAPTYHTRIHKVVVGFEATCPAFWSKLTEVKFHVSRYVTSNKISATTYIV